MGALSWSRWRFFLVVFSIGGYNRYRLVPAVEDSSPRALLLGNVTVESVVLVGVLGVAALLIRRPLMVAADTPDTP
jgi:putative copper export protein